MLTDGLYVALASMLAGDSTFPGRLFMAVGSGEAEWDEAAPESDRATRRLANEVARRRILPQDVIYLTPDGLPSATPTPRLRLRARFPQGQDLGTLRECGVVGGAASTNPLSGTLLVYYVHPRIEKTAQTALDRRVRIDLTPSALPPGTRVTRYLANARSTEFHDLENTQTGCQIELIRFDRCAYLASVEEAQELGYDFCAYCFGSELSER